MYANVGDGYVPNEEEREVFENYIEKMGITDDKEIQEAWNDYRDDLEKGNACVY